MRATWWRIGWTMVVTPTRKPYGQSESISQLGTFLQKPKADPGVDVVCKYWVALHAQHFENFEQVSIASALQGRVMAGGAESRCLWTPHHTENLPASRPLDIRPHQRGAARTCCRSRVPPPVLALRAGRFPGRRTGPASRANLGTPHNGHTRVLKRGGYALCVILCRSHSPVHVQHETLFHVGTAGPGSARLWL